MSRALATQAAPKPRVLIVGTSSEPWNVDKPKDKGVFRDFFQKIIYAPLPDYPSRTMLWVSQLEKAGVLRPSPDEIQTLSRISDYYSYGAICNVVKRTLTARRVERLPRKPFKVSELIGPLAKDEPVEKHIAIELRNWYQEGVPACAGKKDDAAAAAPKKDGGKKKK